MRRAVLVSSLVALIAPAQAFAHATLERTSPGFRQRLERSPAQVRLQFDQAVKAFPGSIEVFDSRGKVFSGATAFVDGTSTVVTAPVRHLRKGFYTVRWHALSADGHVVAGVYTFGVRAAAPPPTEAYGASGPTRTEHVVRWAYFVALALLLGGLGFRLLVVRGPLPPRAERRFYWITGLGVVGVLEVGIAAFLLRAEDALQLPFGKLLYGDLSPIAGGTRFGAAFIAMTLGFALVAAFLYLAWLTDRELLLWPAFLLGLAFASGLSLSGHSAVDAGSSGFSELADWLHLAAATLWIGGLVQLAAVVWPTAPELRRIAFVRFSRLATVCVAILVAAGTYLSILRLPHVHDLWTAGYGRVLLVKLGLVSVALAWGGLHKLVALPAVERGDGRILARLPRSLAGESAVAMAVLLVAAILVDSKPPPQPVSPKSAQPPAAVRAGR
jgi:copper transport protein